MPSSGLLYRVCGATLFVVGALPSSLVAQDDLNISVSPTPIGAGARAAGMADAFVAIADDATAASWNPAGLVQLETPELSIVGAWNRVEDYFDASTDHPEVDGMHDVEHLDLNYLSFVYPLPFLVLERNVTVSLNYQQKYDFTRKFSTRKHQFLGSNGGSGSVRIFERFDFEQTGGLSTVSPALAFELTHRLSVGASLNLWRSTPFNDNRWTQSIRDSQTVTFFGESTIATLRSKETYEDFRGENFTLGLLWEVNNRWKIGMRYDTAFTGEADFSREGRRLQTGRNLLFEDTNGREKREVRFPDSLALGISYRANDRMTLSLDVTRTDWHDFYVKNEAGIRRSLVDGKDIDDPEVATDMEPTYTVRLGGEYIFVPRHPSETLTRLWTLRGGVFYDEEPATGTPDRNGRGDGEADKFYGFALGFGVQLNQRVNIDAAYQYRTGRDVNSDFLRGIDGFEEDIDQHRILLSTVIYFN